MACINTKIAAIAANPSQYIQTGTYFAYDEAGHLLGEYTQAGSPIQETVWLGDIPVAVMAGASNYYIYTDHLNSPRAIADSTGKSVWRWQDVSFGTSAANPDPDGDGVQFNYNLRFPGQYYDQSTGLNYNWNRSYDPNTGRYLESDPIGLEGGLNTYGYVNGNPVNAVDPTGEFAVAAGRGLLGLGLGMLATPASQDAMKAAANAIGEMCESDKPKKCQLQIQRPGGQGKGKFPWIPEGKVQCTYECKTDFGITKITRILDGDICPQEVDHVPGNHGF